jgi:IS5 family transposase
MKIGIYRKEAAPHLADCYCSKPLSFKVFITFLMISWNIKLLKEPHEGQPLYADSAYTGEEQEKTIKKAKMKNCVIEKGYKNKPLTDEQKATNKAKSKIRVRVEHVFGFVENSMHGSYISTIGLVRANAVIGLMNLTYNIFRYIQLQKVVYRG